MGHLALIIRTPWQTEMTVRRPICPLQSNSGIGAGVRLFVSALPRVSYLLLWVSYPSTTRADSHVHCCTCRRNEVSQSLDERGAIRWIQNSTPPWNSKSQHVLRNGRTHSSEHMIVHRTHGGGGVSHLHPAPRESSQSSGNTEIRKLGFPTLENSSRRNIKFEESTKCWFCHYFKNPQVYELFDTYFFDFITQGGSAISDFPQIPDLKKLKKRVHWSCNLYTLRLVSWSIVQTSTFFFVAMSTRGCVK